MENDETPTPTVPLARVFDVVECKIHKRLRGIPCFLIPKSNGFGYFAGICNLRAKKAGFFGQISTQSFSRFGGVTPRPKRQNYKKK